MTLIYLLKGNLKELASDLNKLENCKHLESNTTYVECEIIVRNKGEIQASPVQFVRDLDGKWRIDFF